MPRYSPSAAPPLPAGVMGIAMFYHLTRSAPGDTVTNLATRAMGQGWRVMVRGTDAARLSALDARLWLGRETSFLPHGLEGGPHDADQPVLLGTGAAVNGARALMLLDGAGVSLSEAQAMERVWVIFDGADEVALGHARGQWKQLTEAGIAAQYWSEESGNWARKAES